MADIPENAKAAGVEACTPDLMQRMHAVVGVRAAEGMGAGAAAGAAVGALPGAGAGAFVGGAVGVLEGMGEALLITPKPDAACVIEKLSTPPVKGNAQGQER